MLLQNFHVFLEEKKNNPILWNKFSIYYAIMLAIMFNISDPKDQI